MNQILAKRVLKRGDRLTVRFVDDFHPARVVKATRAMAIVNLLKVQEGEPKGFDGEVLLTFRKDDEVRDEAGNIKRGVWRQSGFTDGFKGLVYRDGYWTTVH